MVDPGAGAGAGVSLGKFWVCARSGGWAVPLVGSWVCVREAELVRIWYWGSLPWAILALLRLDRWWGRRWACLLPFLSDIVVSRGSGNGVNCGLEIRIEGVLGCSCR